MTSILETVVLPTNWLSLSVGAISGATSYFVEVTPEDGDATTHTVPATERLRKTGAQYLQRVAKLTRGVSYTIRAASVVDGVQGEWSAPKTVVNDSWFSMLRKLRQAVHEGISAPLTLNGESVTFNSDNFGQAKVLKRAVGHRGPVVSVGVTYASDDVFNEANDLEHTLVVPIRVSVKVDEEEDGQDAADLAEIIRNRVAALPMAGSITWSIQAPEQREKLAEVQMQINLRGFRDPEAICD